MNATILPGGWRVLDDFGDWSFADILRQATQRDTPSLDVRVRYEGGRYWVDVRGTK